MTELFHIVKVLTKTVFVSGRFLTIAPLPEYIQLITYSTQLQYITYVYYSSRLHEYNKRISFFINLLSEELNLIIQFQKDENLFFHEGDFISSKYSQEQIRYICQKTNLRILDYGENEHVTALLIERK